MKNKRESWLLTVVVLIAFMPYHLLFTMVFLAAIFGRIIVSPFKARGLVPKPIAYKIEDCIVDALKKIAK